MCACNKAIKSSSLCFALHYFRTSTLQSKSKISHLTSTSPSTKMFNSLASFSLLFASATLLQPCLAFPSFTDSTVAYLTNCQTSDTQAVYSEVDIYSDVAQSFAGQGPEIYDDTSLGATFTWEGAQGSWSYAGGDPNQADTFQEVINANAQDPSIPVFSQVGCGRYTQGFPGGALGHNWNCYKDNPRQLYSTSDHECTTVYYCRITTDACPALSFACESF